VISKTVDLCDRLGVAYPVVQAGLGGGLARAELAAAVSRAGGLGTVGVLARPEAYRAEIGRAKELAGNARIAANLLLPVIGRGHVEACLTERVPVVALFFGFDASLVRALHDAGTFVLHQIGTREQARRALADGADGLIVQGAGAGGHVLATEPHASLLPEIAERARDRPVLAAGGIHDRDSALQARALGANGVSVGTRFLLTHESHAHDEYKARLLRARQTLVTLLFGVGWHAPHRVVPNAATERWCANDPLGPKAIRAINRMTESLLRAMPPKGVAAFVKSQRVERPFFSPMALVRGMDARLAEVTPLYAGECVGRIHQLAHAADVVGELAAAFARGVGAPGRP
jgi:NAD(P)H-dependent flavin oxidoreductase YrpB (nitropropane dioxygenase family)